MFPICHCDNALDIQLWRLPISILLPHEVFYHLATKRGMDAKHASRVEAGVGQRLVDMKNHFRKQFNRDLDTCF